MKLIYILLKTSIGRFVFGVLISALSGVFYALTIKLLHGIVERGQEAGDNYWMVILFIFMSSALSIISGNYLTRLYEHKISDLRLSLSEKILKARFELIEGNSLKIIPVLNNDINTIGTFIKTIPEFLVALFKVIGCFVYMFWLSTYYTVFILAVFAMVFSITIVILPRLYRHEQAVRHLRNEMYEHLNGLVNGIKELTLNRLHQSIYIKNTLGPSSVKHSEHMTSIGIINISITKIGEFIVIICLASALFFLNGSGGITDTFMVEYMTLILFVLPSMIIVTNFFRNVKKIDVCMEQIDDLGVAFDEMAEKEQGDVPIEQEVIHPVVELRGVEFEYYDSKNSRFTVGPVDLSVMQNEVVFIVGGNGSGKTSLGKLITGLYLPKKGALMHYGVEVDDSNRNTYRDRYSALFPDSFVFRSFGYIDDEIFDTLGKKYVKELKIDDKVNFENKQLSKINLSYGQQGRLSLLRSLMEDKEIYLFDEWAANQDPHFKKKFYNEILPGLKKKGKTIIAITHDENYFQHADKVVFMENGNIKKIVLKDELVEIS